MQAVQWSSQPVSTGIDLHLSRHAEYVKRCEEIVEYLGDAAADLQRGGADAQQVEQLRGAVTRLLQARHNAQLSQAALQELKGAYVASGEESDFEAAISGRSGQLAAARPYQPTSDQLYRDFQQMATGEDAEEEGGGDEQIGDDLEIVGGAAQLAPNARCPISNRLLLEIEDPVQDAVGVVYEKAAVTDYFRRLPAHKGGRDIIMAGSSHQVTLTELVPAEKIVKEKRRQARLQKAARRGGPARGGDAGDDDVLAV